jgi:hypothetical protein
MPVLSAWEAMISSSVLQPCKTAPRVARRSEQQQMLGPFFLETLLVAKEHGCPLYTDDFGMAALARSQEFKVSSVWSQVVAINALSRKEATEDEYNKVVISLVLYGYRHTTINGAVLLRAAKDAGWANAQPFKDVLETLRGPQTEVRSAAMVVVEFTYLLWQQPIPDLQRNNLIVATLDVLTDQRNAKSVVQFVRQTVRTRFHLLPIAETRVQQIIAAWEALGLNPGIIRI